MVFVIGEATVHNSTSAPLTFKKSGIPGVRTTYRELTDSFSLSYFSKTFEVKGVIKLLLEVISSQFLSVNVAYAALLLSLFSVSRNVDSFE